MSTALEFIVANWSLVVAAICAIILAVVKIIQFISYPTEKKVAELKKRLLVWVTEAELEFGGDTGSIKLSEVYDMFCEAFPYMKKWFPLDKFEDLVDEVLVEMREILKNKEA